MNAAPASVKSARIASYIVGGLLVLLPFHALLTTWLGGNTGHLDLVRIWKEIVIFGLIFPAAGLAYRSKQLRRTLSRAWPVRLIGIYVLIHLLVGGLALSAHRVSKIALVYALIVNLRFLIFFLICLVLASYSDFLKRNYRKILLWPAAVVIVFGLAQRFILPYDFLKHFGYRPDTIPAYQSVDSNLSYRRIQSTLRGANPLGAYLVLVIPAFLSAYRRKIANLIAVLAGLVVLFFSYSRSAWLGLLVTLGIIFGLKLPLNKARIKYLIVILVTAVLAAAASFYLARSNQTAQDTLLHTSSASHSPVSSNQARLNSMKEAAREVIREPWGEGPGTAGPASFRNYGHPPRIAENYYLQLAQEVGVISAVIFLVINLLIAWELYQKRRFDLARLLLASLIGISLINLVSHAWTDDTLSLLWWGLAGVALAPGILLTRSGKNGKKQTEKS